MNKSIVFLFVIIFLILIIWNGIPFIYHLQQQNYAVELSGKPIILISASASSLDSLNTLLQNHSLIENTSIEKDSLITNILIETYNLERARSILNKYDLPDVMRIHLKGSEINIKSYLQLEELIRFRFPEIKQKYDIEHVLEFDKKSGFLKKSYYIVNGILVLFVLLMLTFLRYHFELRKNNYWKIFREAGGRSNYRNRQFWLNTLLLCTVPLGLICGTYYLISAYNVIELNLEPILFGIQFITLLLSAMLCRIFLGANN